MKHFYSGMLIALALALAIVMGVTALAENVEAEAPAVEDVQTPEEAPATDDAPASTDDSAALQEALDAYRAAKQDKRMEDLESELNEYVAAGKLTQEQADLILNQYKDRQTQRKDARGGIGKGGRMNGGMNGGKGGRMNGGMNGGKGGRGNRGNYAPAPDAQPGTNNSGAAWQPEAGMYADGTEPL